MIDVAIVGGGISGLAAAYRLHTLAPTLRLTLIEREARLGGKILSERPGGFLIEGGPDCFLSRKPRGLALCEELGLTERLQGRDPAHAKTFVRHGGTLHRLPEGLSGMVPTNLEALAESTLISPAGQARLAAEATLPAAPGEEDESLAAFITRRLGPEVFERLVEPLMGGIYAGDAGQLSLAATFPQLRALEQEHGSLLAGLSAASPASNSAQMPPFLALRGGMGELVEALLARLDGVTQHCAAGVRRIEPGAQGYELTLADGTLIQSRALILTTPAHIVAPLVAPWDSALAEAHAAIPYASVATLSLAYDAQALPPLDGYGYVIPKAEGSEVLACTWSSSKWQGRAPSGKVLLRLYLGRYGGEPILERSDEELVALALTEVEQVLQPAGSPEAHWLYRWPQAMPQYTMGHKERVALIERRRAAHRGLFLAGAAYRGVGIPDCIREGEQAAQAALAYLKEGVTDGG